MSLRVLLVTVWPVFSEGLKRILQASLIEVVGEAQTSDQALMLAASTLPDIAILEVFPPLLDSLSVARSLGKVSRNTRILLLTPADSMLDARHALESGVRALVRKSDSPTTLIETIHQAAAGEVSWEPLCPEGHRLTHQLRLSPREEQVLGLIAEGRAVAGIGTELGISAKTVEAHRNKLMKKLGIHDVAGVVRFAIRSHIIEP